MQKGDKVDYLGKEAIVTKVGMCTVSILYKHKFMIVPQEDIKELK